MTGPALIHYAPGADLPAPWQPGWQAGHTGILSSLPDRHVARAPAGTPIPPGAEPYTEPTVTPELREAARADCERVVTGADWIRRDIAQGMLDDESVLDMEIVDVLGYAHKYALFAPLTIERLEEACRQHVDAEELWDSRASCALIRCAEQGYNFWRGIGSRLEHIGRADTYEQAEARAVGREGVMGQRVEVIRQMREMLYGWSDDTPFGSLTLATLHRRPWSLRRGPITSEEMGRSWDLPVVAEYEGVVCVARHDERVTWSDEESRARRLAAQREGQRRRDDETARALALLAEHPRLADRIGPRGLTRGTLELSNGMTVEALGPVGMRQDGAVPLALVKMETGQRCWMAVGSFA